MKRVSPSKNVVSSIENALVQIEKQQEHDEEKVEKAIQKLKKRGGVGLHLGNHFEIRDYKGKVYVTSAAMHNDMAIGGMEPSLKGDMYIVGREPGDSRQLVYYKVNGSDISKRDCGQKADPTISRFDLAIIASGDRVEIFNLGKNKTDLYFEGEVEF